MKLCHIDNYRHVMSFSKSRQNISRFARAAFGNPFIWLLATLAMAKLTQFAIDNEPPPFYLTGALRITMAHALLPIYDWQTLKNQKCLIQNPFPTSLENDDGVSSSRIESCAFCEALSYVPVLSTHAQQRPEQLRALYLRNEVPVLLESSVDTFANLSEAYTALSRYGGPQLIDGDLCDFSTNLRTVTNTLNSIIEFASADNTVDPLHMYSHDSMSTTMPTVTQTNKPSIAFYFHGHLCDFSAVKALRRVRSRPAFLADELRPAPYAWLIISEGYDSATMVRTKLISRHRGHVAAYMQLVGESAVQLEALGDRCATECELLEVLVSAGESLLLGELWQLAYRPLTPQTFAVILETY